MEACAVNDPLNSNQYSQTPFKYQRLLLESELHNEHISTNKLNTTKPRDKVNQLVLVIMLGKVVKRACKFFAASNYMNILYCY